MGMIPYFLCVFRIEQGFIKYCQNESFPLKDFVRVSDKLIIFFSN